MTPPADSTAALQWARYESYVFECHAAVELVTRILTESSHNASVQKVLARASSTKHSDKSADQSARAKTAATAALKAKQYTQAARLYGKVQFESIINLTQL